MVKRALFTRNQLGLVSVYKCVESDKKVLHWFLVSRDNIRRIFDLKRIFQEEKSAKLGAITVRGIGVGT